MDGLYLIKSWLQENLQKVAPTTDISIHIDDLLGRSIPKEQILETSLEVYSEFMNQIRLLGDPVGLLMRIPLVYLSSEITMTIPKDLDDLKTNLEDAPPNIYLKSWDRPRSFVPVLEFATPLDFDFFVDGFENVYISYREDLYFAGTYVDDIARSIYFEYYPDGEFYSKSYPYG